MGRGRGRSLGCSFCPRSRHCTRSKCYAKSSKHQGRSEGGVGRGGEARRTTARAVAAAPGSPKTPGRIALGERDGDLEGGSRTERRAVEPAAVRQRHGGLHRLRRSRRQVHARARRRRRSGIERIPQGRRLTQSPRSGSSLWGSAAAASARGAAGRGTDRRMASGGHAIPPRACARSPGAPRVISSLACGR
jgi:hypothetical protein